MCRLLILILAGLAPSGGRRGQAEELPPAAKPKPFSLLAPVGDTTAGRSEQEYELRRATDGSGDLLYDGAGFGARIHPDGSVAFHDKHLGLSFLPPFLPRLGEARGPTLQSTLRQLWGGTASPSPSGARSGRRRDDGLRPSDDPRLIIPNVTPYRPDPREGCRYPAPCYFQASVLLLNVTGTMDVSDEWMRLHGQDPYRYDKARFMTGTRELRIHLASRKHAEDLAQSSEQLPARMETIAGDQGLTLAERRAVLEALAAEMDPGTSEGKAARARIDAFIRARFASPDGGP